MSIEHVRIYFREFGIADRILEFASSSETVDLAAQALHCEPGRIAKSLAFQVNEQPILIVTAGDTKIDNAKFKIKFHVKARMIHADEVEKIIGHAVGGVCPFGIKENVKVYLDMSLQRYNTVFPACGSGNSCIELTLQELERYSNYLEWIEVSKT